MTNNPNKIYEGNAFIGLGEHKAYIGGSVLIVELKGGYMKIPVTVCVKGYRCPITIKSTYDGIYIVKSSH